MITSEHPTIYKWCTPRAGNLVIIFWLIFVSVSQDAIKANVPTTTVLIEPFL